jgi:hypothetical protein
MLQRIEHKLIGIDDDFILVIIAFAFPDEQDRRCGGQGAQHGTVEALSLKSTLASRRQGVKSAAV